MPIWKGWRPSIGEGRIYGVVSGIFDFGGGDLLELKGPGLRPTLIPFSEAAVLEIDLSAGVIIVDPVAAGLVDNVGSGPGSRRRRPPRKPRRQGRQGTVSFRATVLTLYPEMFPGHLGHSLSGRALGRGDWTLETVQIRDFAEDRHRTVDDTPAGGGAGMVLRPDVLARAIDHAVAAWRRCAPGS